MNPLHPTQGEKGKDDLLPIQPCGEGPSDYSVPEAANTAALADLLARVEKAEGTDRELERDLAVALGWQVSDNGEHPLGPDFDETWTDPSGVELGVFECPVWWRCTASLDAALSLVERVLPGHQWELCWGGSRENPVAKHADFDVDLGRYWRVSDGATPALALLAAMLKALIAKGSEQ